MDEARIAAAYSAYLERMLGIPLQDGLCAESDALWKGCPPFLLGCIAMELRAPHGMTRAERPCEEPLPARAYAKDNAREYDIYMPGPMPSKQGNASPILQGEKVSGVSRLPNVDCSVGVRSGGGVVSWASASDMGGVWNITVETHRAFRGKGYGSDCVCALTRWLLRQDRAPIFLCERQNAASGKTAVRAGYRPYGTLLRWGP